MSERMMLHKAVEEMNPGDSWRSERYLVFMANDKTMDQSLETLNLGREMKTHYIRPFTGYKGHSWSNCGRDVLISESTDDYRETDCIRCINAMSPGEKMHHENNNIAYQEHVKKDGRRAGNNGNVVSQRSRAHPVVVSIRTPLDKAVNVRPRGRAGNRSALDKLRDSAKGLFSQWRRGAKNMLFSKVL